MRKIKGNVFHHSATSPPDSSDGQCLYEMSINPAHLKNRGILSKAEYHYIIARNGRMIKCTDDHVLLGHCGCGRNYDTIGICCEGNFLYQKPTQNQYNTLVSLSSTLSRQYGIKSGQLLRHKDVMATACPGLNFPFDSLKSDIEQSLMEKPVKATFTIGSRLVLLEFGDSMGLQVRKIMTKPCQLVFGKAVVHTKCLADIGMQLICESNHTLLRDYSKHGCLVEYNNLTKDITIEWRGNGR
jgi:hypothetical protein